MRSVATHPNIVGMVSSRPSASAWGIPDFAAFCGTGGLRFNLGKVHGVMSPLANVTPGSIVRVWSAFEAGDYKGAAKAVGMAGPAGVVEQGGEAVVGIRVSLDGRRVAVE